MALRDTVQIYKLYPWQQFLAFLEQSCCDNLTTEDDGSVSLNI